MHRLAKRMRNVVCLSGILVALTPAPAAAQQQLQVVCGAPANPPAQYATITSALAALISPSLVGQTNTINVSGACNQEGQPIVQNQQIVGYRGLTIAGFRGLTIQGSVGAIVAQTETACGTPTTAPGAGQPVLVVSDSHVIAFNGLTLRGGQGVSVDASTGVGFRGVTVEKSRGTGINVGPGSQVNLQGQNGPTATPNVIQDNCGNGVNVGPGGLANINLGATLQRNFIGVSIGGFAFLTASQDASGQILIQDNQSAGARVFGGQIRFSGQAIVQTNGNGTDPNLPDALRAGVIATAGGTVDAGGGGLQVLNNNGPGIWADINSQVLFGPVVVPDAATINTISGNAAEGLRLTHMSIAQSFAGTTLTGNTQADATCDDTSLLFGSVTGIVVNACKSTEQPKKK